MKDLRKKNAAIHINTDLKKDDRGSVSRHRLCSVSQGQVVRSGLRELRRLTQKKIHSPPSSQAAPGKEDRGSRRVFADWVAELWTNPCSALTQWLHHSEWSTLNLSPILEQENCKYVCFDNEKQIGCTCTIIYTWMKCAIKIKISSSVFSLNLPAIVDSQSSVSRLQSVRESS